MRDYQKIEPHELFRCRCCNEIKEVIAVDEDSVTFINRNRTGTQTVNTKIFDVSYIKLTSDEVLEESNIF